MQELDEYNCQLFKLIEFFDQYLRHYKRNIKVSTLLKKFNNISENLVETIPAIKEIKIILEKINKDYNSDNVFGDEIINQNIKWEDINTFDEFILFKIFMGIKIRFEGESIKYYSQENEEVIKLWEDEYRWNKANELIKSKLNNFDINFLAHANNIQWSKIIEYPIYKLLKMNNIKSKGDNEI